MNAGAYNRRITIQKRKTERGRNLITQEAWEDYYTNYAYMNKLSGSEFWAAAEVASQSTVRFTMRWHEKLEAVNTKDFRIVVGKKEDAQGTSNVRIFNITNVDDVKFRHESVKLSGVEVV